MKSYQITKWCQELLRVQVPENGFYIDATTGNGHDTLFLCGLAKEQGHVLGFDIQQQALDHTREMLVRNQMEDRAELICDSHVNMGQYAEKESADAICFNFGYLPGGDHALATKPGTSLEAIREGLKLLKKGGVMSLCIYSGGDSGFEERDVILSFLRDLDDQRYIVIVNQYFNRKNNPPIPAFIIKK
ncbi:tRNA (mnm(5)s(2)U34)-methyltransferase [uncultured Robinsoniella sp.]|uniref:tRNA (mnm(5)s(2)U34)-methyltransferase n=1 Tax=uncultured Robinsoniella sp. TaxID=904190 RepID=UPI00374F3AED